MSEFDTDIFGEKRIHVRVVIDASSGIAYIKACFPIYDDVSSVIFFKIFPHSRTGFAEVIML